MHNFKNDIKGNSSAELYFFQSSCGKNIVRKICRGSSANRLEIQIRKQQAFDFTKISTPKIIELVNSKEVCRVDMDYVSGMDFVNFTNASSKEEFDNVIDVIIDLLKFEFDQSANSTFPLESWKNKIQSTMEQCKIIPKEMAEKVSTFLLRDVPTNIPIGRNHGDLTFSNMIINKHGRVTVFDFLNPPIETPYEDLAKILIDADFFWTLNKYAGDANKTRVKILWKYAAKKIKDSMNSRYEKNTLSKFQVLGMTRIIPYTKDDKILKYLLTCIEKLVTN